MSRQLFSKWHQQDGPEALKDISFTIRSGERIGIGKSVMDLDKPMLTPVQLDVQEVASRR
jgi:hypothetical protein